MDIWFLLSRSWLIIHAFDAVIVNPRWRCVYGESQGRTAQTKGNLRGRSTPTCSRWCSTPNTAIMSLTNTRTIGLHTYSIKAVNRTRRSWTACRICAHTMHCTTCHSTCWSSRNGEKVGDVCCPRGRTATRRYGQWGTLNMVRTPILRSYREAITGIRNCDPNRVSACAITCSSDMTSKLILPQSCAWAASINRKYPMILLSVIYTRIQIYSWCVCIGASIRSPPVRTAVWIFWRPRI